ncbi:MAG TPA: hypothetical protein VLF94_00945 [Chlamydiales bacterium]|nr:hypothetical protein [Chlamydiales bacterium]
MNKVTISLFLFIWAYAFAQDEAPATPPAPAAVAEPVKEKPKSRQPFRLPVRKTVTEPPPAPATPPPPVQKQESLLTESYWKFHHSAYVGYRRDRQQFNTYGSGILNSRTLIKNRNSAILTATSYAEVKNIAGYLMAGYGWLINGSTDFRVPGNLPPLSFPSFNLGAGYNVEVRAALAWRLGFSPTPNIKLSFLPGIGYRYAHMMNWAEGSHRITIPGTNNSAYCQYPKPNQQDWFGFYAEGTVEMLCWNFFEWRVFCQYHQPYLVSKSSNLMQIYQYNLSGTLTSDQLSRTNSVLKSGDLHMVLGGTHFKFAFGDGWAVGTHFEGASTWKKAHDHAHLKQTQLLSSPPTVTTTSSKDHATVQWTFFSLSIMVDRRF